MFRAVAWLADGDSAAASNWYGLFGLIGVALIGAVIPPVMRIVERRGNKRNRNSQRQPSLPPAPSVPPLEQLPPWFQVFVQQTESRLTAMSAELVVVTEKANHAEKRADKLEDAVHDMKVLVMWYELAFNVVNEEILDQQRGVEAKIYPPWPQRRVLPPRPPAPNWPVG